MAVVLKIQEQCYQAVEIESMEILGQHVEYQLAHKRSLKKIRSGVSTPEFAADNCLVRRTSLIIAVFH
jgi:hypothetical protein